MSQLDIKSTDQMGPLEVSVYGPKDDTVEFLLSSSKTFHSVQVTPGRYAVVARRPSGARLRHSIDVNEHGASVDLSTLVSSSPNEFMSAETMRGSVTRDFAALSTAPWRSRLGGIGETVLRGAMVSTLSTLGVSMEVGGLADTGPGAAADSLWQRVQRANWTLRLWSLGDNGWEDGAQNLAAITPQANISSEFLKVVVRTQRQPLALGLLDDKGLGPIVNLPPFVDGIEISFLSRSLTTGTTDRTHSPGGLRVPVAILCLTNRAAQDLMAALAEPRTPPAEELWIQSSDQLYSYQGPWQMLIDKFERPAEALLAAHYLLRFLPGKLPVEWADNLSRALPTAMDGPVIAAWARLHNRPLGISDKKFNLDFRERIESAVSRPVTLFARTRALLFDALRLIENPTALIEKTREAGFRRFGAEAGGLEAFWGGGPTLPGEQSASPSGSMLAKVTLEAGAFNGLTAGPGLSLPLEWNMPLGVTLDAAGATFTVWAEKAAEIYVAVSQPNVPIPGTWRPTPADLMVKDAATNYWSKKVPGVKDGWRYRYWVVGEDGTPSPNSNLFKRDPRAVELAMGAVLPDIDCILRRPNNYPWHDADFVAPKLSDMIIYQFHIGVFYAYQGGVDIRRGRVSKFLDAMDRIEYWASMGINAIEPLPIVEWQGTVSGGYSNVDFFSPEGDYCLSPADLAPYVAKVNALLAKRSQPPITASDISDQRGQLCAFVDLCHLFGIAVIGDVVYNHAGPPLDDQSMRMFSRPHNQQGGDPDDYFQGGQGWVGGRIFDYRKGEVRSFITDNALDYFDTYHFDGFRYDEVTVIVNNGGDQFCKDLTRSVRNDLRKPVQISEYWNWDRAHPVENGGLGFDATWDDRLQISVRQVMADVAHGASQPIALEPIRDALGPAPFFPSVFNSIRYLENHDLVSADNRTPDQILPRIAKLASWDDPNTDCGRGRSRVATGILLTCPGIPMLFMGEEFAENKAWHPDPVRIDLLIWWDGLNPAQPLGRNRRDFNRFVRELCGLRNSLPALRDAGINVYHVNNYDRVIAFQRWVPGVGKDVLVVASFRESVYRNYSLPVPISGHFREAFNGAAYDLMPAGGGYTAGAPGNPGGIDANGPPLDGCPYSATCVLPPFSFLVFVHGP